MLKTIICYTWVTRVPFAVVKLVVQFPARGWTQVLLCLFPGVLWLWHFLYSVGPHSVSSLHIYTFVVSRAFMTDAVSKAGDADSSRAPGLTSGLQASVNVHRGALLLVPQWQCISSFVFRLVVNLFHHFIIFTMVYLISFVESCLTFPVHRSMIRVYVKCAILARKTRATSLWRHKITSKYYEVG